MTGARVPFAGWQLLTVLVTIGIGIGIGGVAVARPVDPVIEPQVDPEPRARIGQPAPPAPAGAVSVDDGVRVFPTLAAPSLSHERQFGIAVLPGTGFRVLFPYQEGVYCGEIGKRVCSARLPVYLDVQASFGFTAHWDVLTELRLGLEDDFARTRAVALIPGVRYWVDPSQWIKFFTTLQLDVDLTEQHNHALTGYDLAVHNGNGLMFEVMRDLGFYVQLSETIGFVRWLRFEVDVGAGVQARFP
jgi:hypothetical protein